MASKLDMNQILQEVYDSTKKALKTDLPGPIDVTFVSGDISCEIDAADGDNIAISDGTNTMAVNSDGSINVVVSSSSLPSDAATSTNQNAANNFLNSIDNKTPVLLSGRVPVDGSGTTQPVSISSLPLPTPGQKTSANSNPVVIASDQSVIAVQLNDIRKSAFREVLVGARDNIINIRPTWGVTDLRDFCTVDGVTYRAASLPANSINETGGEIRIQSGTAANNLRTIRTLERGQYQSGAEAEIGVGIRIPQMPTGNQFMEWGYFDTNNGFGYGVDSVGNYVFSFVSGLQTKTYQSQWNMDKLNGIGPSGLTLDYSQGVICTIIFVWYGYGTIRFFLDIFNPVTLIKEQIEIHRSNTSGTVSITDPNQPISIRIGNGNSTNTNRSIYVGGRQYSIVGSVTDRQRRVVTENLAGYSISAISGTWVPLIVMRRKATFGPSGRENSVRTLLKGIDYETDNNAEFRVTVRGTTSGGTFSTPTDMLETETACETKIQTGTTITETSLGVRVLFASTTPGRGTLVRSDVDEETAIGSTFEVVLSARRLTSNSTTVNALLRWEEEW